MFLRRIKGYSREALRRSPDEQVAKFQRFWSKWLSIELQRQGNAFLEFQRHFRIRVGRPTDFEPFLSADLPERQANASGNHQSGTGGIEESEELSATSGNFFPDVPKSERHLKEYRKQLLAASQERWRPIAGRRIPFAWVHNAAGVDHKDAYNWKSGKLSEKSAMTKSIERVLQATIPPKNPSPARN